MSTFKKVLKYSKPSQEIDEKIENLDVQLKKTLGEAIANSTSGLYSITDYIEPQEAVPPTNEDVPDTSGITGDGFVQPTGGGDVNDPATWDSGWQDTSYLYNENELAGETDRSIVKSVPNPPAGDAPAAGGGIVISGAFFGTSVGYIKDGNEYKQVLVGGLIGGTENPGTSGDRGDYYRFLSDEEFNYAVAFWNAYQSTKTTATKGIKAWRTYNRFHDFQRGGEWETWTGGPKRTDANGRRLILDTFGIFVEPNQYESDPGSPYQPGFTRLLQRYSLGDPNYYPGPIAGNIGDKWGLSPQAYSELIAGNPETGGQPGYGGEYTNIPSAAERSNKNMTWDSHMKMWVPNIGPGQKPLLKGV